MNIQINIRAFVLTYFSSHSNEFYQLNSQNIFFSYITLSINALFSENKCDTGSTYLSFVEDVLLDDIFGYGSTLIHLKAGEEDSKKLGSLIMVVFYKHKTYFAPIYIIVCFLP